MLAKAISAFVLLATCAAGVAVRDAQSAAIPPGTVCAAIAKVISSASSVFYPGTPQYASDNFHAYGTSSINSTCSVEPGTAEDVSRILLILGTTRTPYAVKSGGHAYNKGFSATTGVQIAMTRFNEITYDANASSVTVGSGNTWNPVYEALAPHSVNVVGGRIQNIGVVGFILGGGFSWLTNQRGLGLDNVLSFDVVLPTGGIVTTSPTSRPDLFNALRGGGNNFGIVTRVVIKTYPQGQIWGGVIYTPPEGIDPIRNATLQFVKNQDPKASVLVTFGWIGGQLATFSILFYDGPKPPAGIFDGFLTAPALVNTVATQSFLSFYSGTPADTFPRTTHQTVPTSKYDAKFVDAFINETKYWGPRLAAIDPTAQIVYSLEPTHRDYLSFGSNSAWPSSRSLPLLPTTVDYKWTDPAADATLVDANLASTAFLQRKSLSGVNINDIDVVRYPNYAKYPETSPIDIYGRNLASLREVKKKYDPFNVTSLTGGWKFE